MGEIRQKSINSSFLIRNILSSNTNDQIDQNVNSQQSYQSNESHESHSPNNYDIFTNKYQQLMNINMIQSLFNTIDHSNGNDSRRNSLDNQLFKTDRPQTVLNDSNIEQYFYQNLCYYALQQQIIRANNVLTQDVKGRQSQSSSSSSSSSSNQPIGQNNCLKSVKTISKRKPMKNRMNKLSNKSKSKSKTNDQIDSNENNNNKNDLSSLKMMITNMSNEIIQNQPKKTDQSDSISSTASSNSLPNHKYRKIRRNRTVFTELQLMGLERRFDSQKYLSTPDRTDLARALGLTQLQVKTWYQNRRMKWKKQVMQNGCPFPPTKPKGRPKKDSIPTYGIEFTKSILCPILTTIGDSVEAETTTPSPSPLPPSAAIIADLNFL